MIMLSFRSLCASTLILVMMVLSATDATAKVVFPIGLRIGIEPPGETKLVPGFAGFRDSDHRVEIHILDLPGTVYPAFEMPGQLEKLFNKNQNLIEELKRENFQSAGGIGVLVSGRIQINGIGIYRWLFLLSAGSAQDLTALITVDVPETAHAIYTDAEVRKALATVAFRPAPVEEQLSLLPFKLEDLAGFRIIQVASGEVILTEGTSNGINKQPYIMISIGNGVPNDRNDRSRFASDLLTLLPLRDLSLQSGETMRILGLPGYEIRATAKDANGDSISLVQWVRFTTGGFMRIVGVTRTDAWDTYFPRFRQIRDGITFK